MKAPETDWPPMLAEKYHGKRALDAAKWIGDAR